MRQLPPAPARPPVNVTAGVLARPATHVAVAVVAAVCLLGIALPASADETREIRQLAQIRTVLTEQPPGIARPLIIDLQTQLTERGFRPGPIDGVVGGQTRSAVRAYQRAAGMRVDGIPTKELLDVMKYGQPQITASTPAPSSRAAPRSDPLVREIQAALTARGYDTGGVDGIAGPKTRAAAKSFRSEAGLAGGTSVDPTLLDQLKTTDAAVGAESGS